MGCVYVGRAHLPASPTIMYKGREQTVRPGRPQIAKGKRIKQTRGLLFSARRKSAVGSPQVVGLSVISKDPGSPWIPLCHA